MIWNTAKKDREAILKTLSRIVTEIVLQRQEIGTLKMQLEEMSKSREQMYARLLDAFIKVVALPVQRVSLGAKLSSADEGLFEEVPLGDSRGYKESELDLETRDD